MAVDIDLDQLKRFRDIFQVPHVLITTPPPTSTPFPTTPVSETHHRSTMP